MAEVDNESVRQRILRLAFDGDSARFDKFIRTLQSVAPKDCQVILRGSAVTGRRWADGQPFDADGPGTSDLDVTFLGGDMISHWEEFYIPRMHTAPLGEDHPDAAPPLNNLRAKLCKIACRPVNLQASVGLVQFARDVLFDQPYFTLIEKSDEPDRETSAA